MRTTAYFLLLCLLLCLGADRAAAYSSPRLKWKTVKTEHFEVHFHEGAEWTARMVAHVAEEVHGPLTDLYQYEPSIPVHFIIKDTDDYANGAAYFYDNKVEIWATNLEFGFRGTTEWIRNVVTHEYAHIISIQASTRMPKRIPAVYFQMITFEDEKRPDVLQGYPKDILSYPYSGVMMPPWYAEGVSQYQSPDKQYDCWDAHRDMILRCAVLDDKMLTYDEMGFFGKSSLQSEQVYDHGYGLVSYIADQYGPDAITEITNGLKTFYRWNMDGALKKGTGKSGKELYKDWRAHLEQRYAAQTGDVVQNQRVGSALASDGFMIVAPTFSPDGTKIAYLSNKGLDYSVTSLYTMNRDGKKKNMIAGNVSTPPNFSPDGNKIVYSRKVKQDRYGSYVNDIFVYDVKKKIEKKLTDGSRAGDPDFSPDGKQIVCVLNGDGTHKLAIVDADGENMREIYADAKGVQFYNPHFSPDGSRILFGIFKNATRDIATISSDGSDFQYVLESVNDERDARWTRSGNGIIFSSDRTGIFNIYEMALDADWVQKRSNVIGGAFMPAVSPTGDAIVYNGYGAEGYHVYLMDGDIGAVEALDRIAYNQRAAGEFDECQNLRTAGMERQQNEMSLALADNAPIVTTTQSDVSEEGLEDTPGAQFAPTKYKSAYTPFQFYPRFVVWDGKVRLGLFMSSYEIMDKQNFFLGGAFGVDKEYNAFVSYEVKNFFPTLFADFIILREKTTDKGFDDDPESPSFEHSFDFDIRYDLWNADIGARFEFTESNLLTRENQLSLYWSHGEYRVNIEGKEFEEDGSFLGSFKGGWKYYVGDQLNLRWSYKKLARATDVDINPRFGRNIHFHYMRSFDDLFTSGEFLYGFRPELSENHYNQFTLDWREYMGLPWFRHSLRMRLYGTVIDETVDDFFWAYLGGRDGIRGYSFYSVGGRKGYIGSLTYRFPLLRNINKQFMHLYFRDVTGSVFYEVANAWDERGFQTKGLKESAGWELRVSLGSYYVFPTDFSVVGAYALVPAAIVGTSFGGLSPNLIVQDRGWTYYFTLGFGFDL